MLYRKLRIQFSRLKWENHFWRRKREIRDFEALRRNQIPSSSRSSSFFTSGWAISLSLSASLRALVWEGFEEGSKSKVKNAVCVCVCIVWNTMLNWAFLELENVWATIWCGRKIVVFAVVKILHESKCTTSRMRMYWMSEVPLIFQWISVGFDGWYPLQDPTTGRGWQSTVFRVWNVCIATYISFSFINQFQFWKCPSFIK